MIDLPIIPVRLDPTFFPRATLEELDVDRLSSKKTRGGAWINWPSLEYLPGLWVQWPGIRNDNCRPWGWGG